MVSLTKRWRLVGLRMNNLHHDPWRQRENQDHGMCLPHRVQATGALWSYVVAADAHIKK